MKLKPNRLSQTQLKQISKALLKLYDKVQQSITARRQFNEAFDEDQRRYIRTIRVRFIKWEKYGFPEDYYCNTKERRQTLLKVINMEAYIRLMSNLSRKYKENRDA